MRFFVENHSTAPVIFVIPKESLCHVADTDSFGMTSRAWRRQAVSFGNSKVELTLN